MVAGSEAVTDNPEAKLEDPFLGELLCDRYRVASCIGRGGMGIVYQGVHVSLGKRVAIKRLDHALARDPMAFERFRGEAIAASHVESPHVVQVFDWGKSADGSPFIVMELLEGRTLREHLDIEGRLLPAEAARITCQILSGLLRIHQAQIVHRDIKPENVFLCGYDDGPSFVKLLDFGISKRQAEADSAASHSTKPFVILGTALYMSPEQAKGELPLDERTDLYSVGAVLFEMLTGQPPHPGPTYEAILVDACTRDADDIRVHCPLASEALALTVARALERSRDARIASCSEFQRALFAALPELETEPRGAIEGGRDSSPKEAAKTEPALTESALTDSSRTDKASPSKRRPSVLALALLGVALSALAAQVMLRNGPGPRANVPVPSPRASATLAESSDGRVGTANLTASESAPRVTTAGSATMATSPPISIQRSRPESAPKPRAIAPNASAGVLGGLKLRRSMP